MTEKTYCKEFCQGRFVTEINRLDKALEEYKTKIRAEVIEEFKEKMRKLNQLNCFVDYVADEIDLEELMYYASDEIAEQLKENK